MITLLDATWLIPTAADPHILLNRVTAHFGRHERVGILAAAGAGKSTLARALSGISPPDSGQIVSRGRISWPLGFAGALHPELTGAENIAILARAAGADPHETLAFCTIFAGGAVEMHRKLKYFAPAHRLALSFSLSMALPCDHYIADEVIGFGDADMRARCTAMLDRRLAHAGLVFISRNPKQLDTVCTRFMALCHGQLIACPSPQVAAQMLELAAQDIPDFQERPHV